MTNNFSKMLIEKIQEKKLNKKTNDQLKNEVKESGIYVKGIYKLKKQELVDILEEHYRKEHSARFINSFISKYIRSFFLKRTYLLHHESLLNRDKCVNDTDFYTLEPLKNIPDNQFFAYRDEKDFYYGFNIFSLEQLLPNKCFQKKCVNPYTREPIGINVQSNIKKLIQMIKIIDPKIVDMNKDPVVNQRISSFSHSSSSSYSPNPHRFLGNSLYPPRASLTQTQIHLIYDIIEKRSKSMDARIQDLFYEIDLLGNYTQRKWFDDLGRNSLMRFFSQLRDFWNERGGIRSNVKLEICSLNGDPFYNIIIHNSNAISTEKIKEACLLVMENLVFTGINDVSRNTGVIYILMNLALVSEDVRNSISWLQE